MRSLSDSIEVPPVIALLEDKESNTACARGIHPITEIMEVMTLKGHPFRINIQPSFHFHRPSRGRRGKCPEK